VEDFSTIHPLFTQPFRSLNLVATRLIFFLLNLVDYPSKGNGLSDKDILIEEAITECELVVVVKAVGLQAHYFITQ